MSQCPHYCSPLWDKPSYGERTEEVAVESGCPELTCFSFSLFRSLMYTHTKFILSPDVPRVNVCKRTDAFRQFPPLNPVKMSLWWQFDFWHRLLLNWMFVIVIVYTSCAARSFVPSFCKPFGLCKLYNQTTKGKDITFTISINAKIMISYGWC